VATELRVNQRRQGDRRVTPGDAMDVSRLEHENLCAEVEENVRTLRRIEHELRNLRLLIEQLHGLKHAS
jgi:hypothetical protein